MDEPKCEGCRFYKPREGRNGGDCRRYPPIANLEAKNSDPFPVVYATDWCGEYQEREVARG